MNIKLLPKLLLLLALLLSATAVALPPPQTQATARLWADVSLGPPLIDWFNAVARPDDIARIDNIDQLALLGDITAGRKLVVFKSVDQAEQIVPRIADELDIVGYNLEQGPVSPLADQADPLGSVQRMRALADRYGLDLAFGPDRRFALSDGEAVAPFVDIFILQVQRVQTEPETVRDFVRPLVRRLRTINPDLSIGMQVRTEGSVEQLTELVASLEEELDGVSILTSPETVEIAEALLAELRANAESDAPEATAVSPAADIGAPPTPPFNANPQSGPVDEPAAPPSAVAPDGPAIVPWLVAGSFLAGVVSGGAAVGLVVALRRRAP